MMRSRAAAGQRLLLRMRGPAWHDHLAGNSLESSLVMASTATSAGVRSRLTRRAARSWTVEHGFPLENMTPTAHS